MPYLIGTDEAGYAPNLGPLVVSASVWHVDASTDETDLYKRLKGVICKSPPRSDAAGRLAIADSKSLYSPAGGLKWLERGVLAALALVNHCPGDWLEVWQLLDPDSLEYLPKLPWHVDYDLRLPLAADAEDIVQLVPKLRRAFDEAGVRLVALKSRAVFPDQFNRSTVEYGTKAEALSKVTLALLAESLSHCGDEPVLAICDKHGARNQYGRLLQQQFPEVLVEVHRESAAESIYRWGPGETRIDVRFRPGGEAFLPVALASMAAKYLRELAMRSFNDFWCGRVRDLAPTAGYPGDAPRFMAAIQSMSAELGIARTALWRDR
jgi:ribonuclease HII